MFENDWRSTAPPDAAEPMPLFWIWYTGWVGRCPSLSILTVPAPEAEGGMSAGFPGFPPSSLVLMSMIGFSKDGGPLAGALGLDWNQNQVYINDMVYKTIPMKNKGFTSYVQYDMNYVLTLSPGGLARIIGVFWRRGPVGSSLPSWK